MASFEAASGKVLRGFFEPWLTTRGAPELTLEQARLGETEAGFEIDVRLASDRRDYDLLVPVQIETEGRPGGSEPPGSRWCRCGGP